MEKTDTEIIKEQANTIAKLVDMNNALIEIQKERDNMLYNFLFVGKPQDGIQPFVTEVRDSLASHGGYIASFRSTLSRVLWIAVTVLITGAIGAFVIWRP